MRLRKLSGLALCLMVLFVMGCGSGSDSTSGNGTETEGTGSSGGDSGSTGGNGTGDGVVDAPGDGDDTDDPNLGDGMTCDIGGAMPEPDDTTGGVPEPEVDDVETSDSSSGSDDDTSTTNPGDVDDPEPLVGMVRIAEMDEDVTDLETDAYRITIAGAAAPKITEEDDFLIVTLSRGGGREEHEFTLVAAPEFREKDPVELAFTIVHDNMGDMAEAYLTNEVEFDLMKIKDLYEEAYPQGDGVVSLAFQTPDGSDCNYTGLEYDLDMTAASP